jgi:hypothetical protein
MGAKRNAYWESKKERGHWEDIGEGGRILLRLRLE